VYPAITVRQNKMLFDKNTLVATRYFVLLKDSEISAQEEINVSNRGDGFFRRELRHQLLYFHTSDKCSGRFNARLLTVNARP